ncbi:MAG: hypothetical protein AAGG51_06980 [Cyanobacteria bacterium P01_G01_bin.54]
MIKNDHEELLKWREIQQKRIAYKKALIPLAEVLAALNSRSAIYEVLWDIQHQPSLWIEGLFSVASHGRVDWRKVPGSTRQNWHTAQDRIERVTDCLVSYAHNLESDIVIAWLENKPALRVKVGDGRACLTEILEVDWETWIYDPEDNWLIESYHEGEVCSGRSAFTVPSER